MEDFLRGLLHDLERRCALLRDRLSSTSSDPDLRGPALTAYREIERVRREVVDLLADPSLGTSALLPNHLQQYKRWHEQATLVEYYPLPFIERYSDADRRLTRLCRHLAVQVGWPSPSPLVGAFSSQYYWTVPEFNVVCAPSTESSTLLSLPDLLHELGHILLLQHRAQLVGDFVRELRDHFKRERQRLAQQGLPPEYQQMFELVS